MKKILTWLFYILSLFMFIASFAITLLILVQMNRRLEKSFMTTINVFVPFGILLLLYMINMIFNQKTVRGNLFYNLTSCIIYATILVVGARTVCDHRLIIGTLNSFNMDFNFFANFLPFMKIMLYGLCIANVLFMFHLKEAKKDSRNVDRRNRKEDGYRGGRDSRDGYRDDSEGYEDKDREDAEEHEYRKTKKHA